MGASELGKKLSKDKANLEGLGEDPADAQDMDNEGGGQASKYDYYNSIGRAKTGSSDVWLTPDYVIKWVKQEFGYLGLDAAADANNSVAPQHIDEQMDALVTPWICSDTVWCNPPYGKQAKEFVERAIDQVAKGNCPRVVMLLAVRTDTKMFQDLIFPKASRIHFIKSRVKFQRGMGKTSSSERPAFASAIVVFENPLPDRFHPIATQNPFVTWGPVV
jgi:site-specific DNA-methyltransferase (adenine-specific)